MANNRRGGGYISGGAGGAGKSVSLLSGGKMIFIGFLVVVIGGAFLLAGGNPFPKNQLTEPPRGVYEIDEETLKADPEGRGNLQLRTIGFKECADQAAVGLLVDRSGSMEGQKIEALKTALRGFGSSLGDQSIVGLYSFSSDYFSATIIREDVPFSRFGDVRSRYDQAVGSLNALGATYTRAALQFVKDKIIAAQAQYPEKDFVLVFMSDGIPEANPADCASGRQFGTSCFANSQDPTQPSDIIDAIKNAGIEIYSIALYNQNDPKDIYFLPDMRRVLQTVASSSETYYETPNPEDLQKIYSEISARICESVK